MGSRFPTSILALALAALSIVNTHGEAVGSAKIHVVLHGGPFPGTYDLVADACMAGLQKQGSWHATWEAESVEKGKVSAVLLGIDPRPTFGNGLTMSVSFGDPDSQLMYEVVKPVTNVVDRGGTATLTFSGEARTTSYEDGTQGKGGPIEITVECEKIIRGNQ